MIKAEQSASFEASEQNSIPQQTQVSISSINIEDREAKNPLLFLLRKNGLRCKELVDNPHRNDVVPEEHDINLIARVTVKHLLNLTVPPKQKISTSTLTRWAKYFKRLFPKTSMSCFYGLKYELSTQRNGTIIQKKRAQGALQVQLFQERRKLIKEDPSVFF